MYQYYRGYTPTQQVENLKRRRHRRRTTLLYIFAAAVLATLAFRVVFPSPEPKEHGEGLASAAAPGKAQPVNQTALNAQINQIINTNPNLEIGVSIIDTTDNTRYDYGLGDTEYIAASTTKLLSAALFLQDVEKGRANLAQPLGSSTAQAEMQRMIVVSDDTAWEDFNALLGHPALLAYAHGLGMNSYDPDNNKITSDDLALLLARLYQGQLLNKQHTNLLLGYMAQADYTQYIGAAIPHGVKFYHKIGYLDDRVMDAAIIDNGRHPYVLVIFTKDPSGTYNQTAGLQAFHAITTSSLNAFAQ